MSPPSDRRPSERPRLARATHVLVLGLVAACGAATRPQPSAEPCPPLSAYAGDFRGAGRCTNQDQDALLDVDDACPDAPEDLDGFRDEDGCHDNDNDGDGIADVDDACPNEPEDFDTFQDADGCPDNDNDGDGIADVDDACPEEPETFNGGRDEDGCPDTGMCILLGHEIRVSSTLEFHRNLASWRPEDEESLNHLADVLNYEGMPVVSLWASSAPGERDRRSLQRRRAEAVRDALYARGVDPSRLGDFVEAPSHVNIATVGISPSSFDIDSDCAGHAILPPRITGVAGQ